MRIVKIGDAYRDNDGNIIIANWEFDAGGEGVELDTLIHTADDLVGICGEAGGLQGFCFFCGTPLIQKCRFNRSIGEDFQQRFGRVPNNLIGRIGHKAVCHKCRIDIEAIVETN